jgi:pimeloyl-ACP methyl ester carboxylesterase
MSSVSQFSLRWLKRLGIALIALLVFILVAGNIYRIVGEQITLEDEPPGELVDIGTHRLHLLCVGEGSPTVMLNSSVAGTYRLWGAVLAGVAPLTRICVFDRSGLGWSEVGPVMPPTVASSMSDLEKLLAASGERPPYIPVGFSLGAILSYIYVEAHRDEVVGFVSIEGFSPEMRAVRPPIAEIPGPVARIAPALEWLGLSPLTQLAVDIANYAAAPVEFSWANVEPLRPQYFLSKRRLSSVVGGLEMDEDLSQQGELGDLPFIVIQGGLTAETTFADPEEIRRYKELQAEYHLRSSQGEFVLIPGATHGSVMQSPDIIVAAITRLVERARAGDSE